MTPIGRILIPAISVLTCIAAVVLLRHPMQMTFVSPKQAVEQLVVALRSDNVDAAQVILGRGSEPLLKSGDEIADRNARHRFVAAYDDEEGLVAQTPRRATLVIGTDEWPFPVPLVKEGNGWRFNAGAGKRELLARQIGRNEIDAIKECKAFVDAEREYAANEKTHAYAPHLNSTGQEKNGLYWKAVEKSRTRSPLGPLFADAEARPDREATPYNGYYFHVLAAQGPAARGGAYSYLARDRMIGGFALIAWPAKYGSSGIMSFIVNDDDVVFQKDLGRQTSADATEIATFNPDKSWTRAAL